MPDFDSERLASTLFPDGAEPDPHNSELLFEQYKLFVETSERLVGRRQVVNTFFLSANALAVSAIGLVAREGHQAAWGWVAITAIAVAAMVLCVAWRTLVRSYAQLNAGKFAVIHCLEEHMPAAVFRAEWVALDEGRNASVYKPFTRTERVVSSIFIWIYALVAGVAVLWMVGCWLGPTIVRGG